MHGTQIDQQETQQLAAWVESQDQSAFESLVERYAPMVHSTCLRSCNGDQQLAEEACQATFIIFAQKAAHIKSAASLPAWLHRCAINSIKMAKRSQRNEERKRKQMSEQEPPETNLTDEEAAEWQAMRPILDAGINRLSEKIRSAIILHYYHGMSVKDIASKTRSSESAIKKRLHEGRNRLRAYFKRSGYTASLAFLSTALQAEALPTCSATIIATCFQASAPLQIPGALSIAQGVMHSMLITKIKITAVAALVTATCTGGIVYAADHATKPEPLVSHDNSQTNTTPTNVTPEVQSNISPLEQSYSVDFNGTPLSEVITTLNKMTGIQIGTKDIALDQPVTLRANEMKLDTILNWIAKVSDARRSKLFDANGKKFIILQANGPKESPRVRTLRILEQKLTLNFKDTTFLDTLAFLSVQTGIPISSTNEGSPINMDLSNVTALSALDFLAALTGLDYAIKENGHIIFTGKEEIIKADKQPTTGTVAAVRVDPRTKTQNLIMLTIEKPESVQTGSSFLIFRGNQYIVKATVSKKFNDMVACDIDQTSWNKNGLQIRVSDRAQAQKTTITPKTDEWETIKPKQPSRQHPKPDKVDTLEDF